jgi:hypothetical protein
VVDDVAALRRGPGVELQPGAGLLQEQPHGGTPRRGAAAEVVVQPLDVAADHRLHLGAVAVQPGADGDPGGHACVAQRAVVGQLPGREQVPPAGHHVHRWHPGQIGAVVVGDVPEVVAGLGVGHEVAPERHRGADHGGVSGLQR